MSERASERATEKYSPCTILSSPPTTMHPSFLESLSIVPTGAKDTYASTSLWRPYGARGVFGGHVIALALISAGETKPSNLSLHSMHCYFLLPAQPDIPLEFKVERLRDGRSYSNRLVRAQQEGKDVFVLLASYTVSPIALPPLPADAETPFGFIPSKNQLQPDSQLAPGQGTKERLTAPVPTVFAEKARTQASIPFRHKWHIPLIEGISSWEDSEEEEDRWARFLEANGSKISERATSRINEYVRVSRAMVSVFQAV